MELEYQLTENDFRKFYNVYYQHQLSNVIGFYILVSVIIGFNLPGDFQWWRALAGTGISASILVLLFYYLPLIVIQRRVMNKILSEPGLFEKKRLLVTDEGLHFTSPLKEALFTYESIEGCEFIKNLIVIKQAAGVFTIIPVDSFKDHSEVANFRGAIQGKIFKIRGKLQPVLDQRKKDNPPYLLGLLCLIPVVGFIVGVLLIILGIIHYKDKWLVIIGTLGVCITLYIYLWHIPDLTKDLNVEQGIEQASQYQLNNVVESIEYYKVINSVYPDSLVQLKNVTIQDPLASHNMNKNTAFNYIKVNNKYKVFSSGKDGIAGTKDDLFPQIPEKNLAKIGLILPGKE